MVVVAVLAGGLATRLRPLTKDLPKSMIQICGQPFVHWQMRRLAKAGVKDVVFCVSYKSKKLKDYLGDGARYGLRITYSHDGASQLGTGGAIVNALPLLGETFMVLYGDSYLPIDFKTIEEAFYESDTDGLMTLYRNRGLYDKSNVEFINGQVKAYTKDGSSDNLVHIDYGLSCFRRSVFETLERGIKIDLAEILINLIDQNQLSGYEIFERFYEIGSLEGIAAMESYVQENPNTI